MSAQRPGRTSPGANSSTTDEDEDEEESTSTATTIRRPPQPTRASGSGEIAGGSYFYAAPADYTPPPRQPKAQRRHTPPETEASLTEKRTKVGPATSSPEQGSHSQNRESQVSQPGARAYSQPPRSPSINTTPATTPSMSPDRRSNRDLDMEELVGWGGGGVGLDGPDLLRDFRERRHQQRCQRNTKRHRAAAVNILRCGRD
ncbi:unnamed protein product, partial [Iphiclides podalirius]